MDFVSFNNFFFFLILAFYGQVLKFICALRKKLLKIEVKNKVKNIVKKCKVGNYCAEK